MSESPTNDVPESVPPPSLGVIDAVGMGWRVLKQGFWRLWLVVLVMEAILIGAMLVAGCCGAAPMIGGFISLGLGLLINVFLQSPLETGLFHAVGEAIDGRGAQVGNLFAGFRLRYGESVVARLPTVGIQFAAMIGTQVVLFLALFGFAFGMGEGKGRPPDWDTMAPMLGIGVAVGLGILVFWIVVAIGQLFFIFAPLAVWDFPRRYGTPIVTSLRLVKEHFFSVLGLAVLFILIALALVLIAAIPGGLLAGAGALLETNWDNPSPTFFVLLVSGIAVFGLVQVFLLFAMMAWQYATLIHLYRSWTGQPLVQPLAAAGPDGDAPVPPAGVLPPGT